MTPLAHGVGARADLPLPTTYVVVGGGLVLVATFLALALLWRQPRLRGAQAGRPLGDRVQAVLDSPLLLGVLRAVVLVLALLVVVIAWFGDDSVAYNPAPYALYVTFWVGLVPVSLLLGPVWARLNPLRTVHAGLRRLMGPAPAEHLLPRLGWYPAAVALLWFAWQELAAPDRSAPRHVAVFLTAYALVQLIASAVFGGGWFARGDGFEVYARLLGRLAPVGRRADGRLVLRSPLDGASGLEPGRGLWAVVVVLVGSTAFDGVTRTSAWQNSRYGLVEEALPATVALALTVVAVALTYLAAAAATDALTGTRGAAAAFAHTLVPIAAGYAVAHYFSLLVLDGQATWILASDPFHTGLDLFGTAGRRIDYSLLTPRAISLVQVTAVVVAHLVALALAHDRSLVIDRTSTRPHRPWVSQLPFLAVMVALTSGGLALLLGT